MRINRRLNKELLFQLFISSPNQELYSLRGSGNKEFMSYLSCGDKWNTWTESESVLSSHFDPLSSSINLEETPSFTWRKGGCLKRWHLLTNDQKHGGLMKLRNRPGRLLRLFLEPKSLTREKTLSRLGFSQFPLVLLGLLTQRQALFFSRSLACLFCLMRELAIAAAMASLAARSETSADKKKRISLLWREKSDAAVPLKSSSRAETTNWTKSGGCNSPSEGETTIRWCPW